MNKKVINTIVGLVIMFGFGFLPAADPITPMGMKVLGTFIGAIYLWLTVDIFWPSIIGLFALGCTGYMTVPQVFSSAFSNNNLILVLFMMILGGVIISAGVADVIAIKILSWKFAQGKPWVIVGLLMIVSFLLSALFGGAPGAIIICWSLLYSICHQVGYKPGDDYPCVAAAAVVFGGVCGNHVLPFHMAVVVPMGFMPEPVDYGFGFTVIAIVMSVLALLLYILAMKFIFKPDTGLMEKGTYQLEGQSTFERKQVVVLTLVIIMMVLMMVPVFAPKGSALQTAIGGLGNGPIVAIAIAVSCLLLYQGKPMVSITDSIQKGVVWPVFFMVMSAFTLATALTSKDTGITPFLNKTITPLFDGKGVLVFVILAVFIAAFATNVVNNAVVSAIMVPLASTFAMSINMNPAVVATLMVFACSIGIALPTGSPAGALFHGNKEWIPGNNALKYGIFGVVLHALLLIVVAFPLGLLVY
jgi:sodium-dependent dicarboxylate transporter 2/3/5